VTEAYSVEKVPAPLLAAGYARISDIATAVCAHHATIFRRAKRGVYGECEDISNALFIRISRVVAHDGAKSEIARERLRELARATRAAALAAGAHPVEGEFALCGLTSET